MILVLLQTLVSCFVEVTASSVCSNKKIVEFGLKTLHQMSRWLSFSYYYFRVDYLLLYEMKDKDNSFKQKFILKNKITLGPT